MQIRKLSLDDLELLVRLRIDFLLEEGIVFADAQLADVRQNCREFFTTTIQANTFVAYVAPKDGAVLSTAFLTLSNRPPRKAYQSFCVGTVYNVLTYPQYRRQGLATKVLTALLQEAKALGVSSVDLLATKDGKELYNKLHFRAIELTPMRREIE